MKTIYYIKTSLLALATMVSCTEMEIRDESQDSTNNGLLQELSVTGQDFKFDGETRSSVTIGESGASFTWDEDDVIGIFPDIGDQVSFAMDEEAGTQTATFSGGGWALKSSAKYAAYYPHVYENRDMTAIPVSYVGQTQNGNDNTDHIGAYDFMAAGISTPSNGAVAFDMQHLGALVQLTISIPKPSILSKVVLSCSTKFTETGTIDLTAKTLSITSKTQSNTLEIALDNVETTQANENVTIYFMMAPVNLTDSDLIATVHFADAHTWMKEISGKNFQAGKAYKLTAESNLNLYYIDEYGVNHGKGTEIDGVVWAPVNCGYHATNYQWGKLYQWGRKYGQGYNGELYEKDNNRIIVSDATTPNIFRGYLTNAAAGSKESNSNEFYYYDRDWLSLEAQDDKLWNSGSEEVPVKTEYDPCPSGWRVPTYSELKLLIKHYSPFTTNDIDQLGCWFSGTSPYTDEATQVFLPAAGYRSSSTGNGLERGHISDYWSSSPHSSGNQSYVLYLYCSGVMHTDTFVGRAQGCSVRCVQE